MKKGEDGTVDEEPERLATANMIKMLENAIYQSTGCTMERWKQDNLLGVMEYQCSDKRVFQDGVSLVVDMDNNPKTELNMEASGYLDVLNIAGDQSSVICAHLAYPISKGYMINPHFDPPHRYEISCVAYN